MNYGNGWFRSGSSTGGMAVLTSVGLVFVISLPSNTGTGAVIDDLALLKQQALADKGIAPQFAVSVEVRPERTAAECLAHIRAVMSPPISELANALGLSRQTIYNWQKGEQPKPEYLNILTDLANAADIFTEANIPVTGALLKRKISAGKNLLALVQHGESATDVARLLVKRLHTEQKQKDLLALRFSNRKNTKSPAEADFPAPNDLSV
jgi:transcriptional regulator with XRE-family HTH domain